MGKRGGGSFRDAVFLWIPDGQAVGFIKNRIKSKTVFIQYRVNVLTFLHTSGSLINGNLCSAYLAYIEPTRFKVK